MSNADHRVIVVTPVFEDIESSSLLFQELYRIFGETIFLVAVDDGSIKQPLTGEYLSNSSITGVVLKLRRNVGHQRAIAIGLSYVNENLNASRIVIMDSDGEDIPNTIPLLLDELDSPTIDVVVAKRENRVAPTYFKVFYSFYKCFFFLMTGRSISFGNFMALKPTAVQRLVAMQELHIHVAATVLASRLRTVLCPIDRGSRYVGHSKMSFVGLALHGLKALMVFAEDVLVRVSLACAGIAAASVTGAALAIGLKMFGFSTPGWFSIALGILILMFLQTGALALMTLMLTGVVRGGTVTSGIAYSEFVEAVIEAPGDPK